MLSTLSRHHARVFRRISKQLFTSAKGRSTKAAFFDETVQTELKALTGLSYDKIFRLQKRGEEIPPPTYQFVTEEELNDLMVEARQKADKKLQMPPVLDEREDIDVVLDRDGAIKGYDAAPIVFTDITFGVHNRDRIIVVREPDGTLREASWEQRDRVNQIYFPTEERKLDVPAMFEPENLKNILGPDKYEYILNRNCIQFEPDHPTYIRTAEAVYEHLNANGHYDVLHSTRHFGPMVFYLAHSKRCDDLVVHYLRKKDLDDAASVVRLFGLLHEDSEVAGNLQLAPLDLIRLYTNSDSLKSSKVHLVLEAALEAMEKDQEAVKGAQESQGAGRPDE